MSERRRERRAAERATHKSGRLSEADPFKHVQPAAKPTMVRLVDAIRSWGPPPPSLLREDIVAGVLIDGRLHYSLTDVDTFCASIRNDCGEEAAKTAARDLGRDLGQLRVIAMTLDGAWSVTHLMFTRPHTAEDARRWALAFDPARQTDFMRSVLAACSPKPVNARGGMS